MANLFVVNSPLQYLMARIIADRVLQTSESHILQYRDGGDFSVNFRAMDEFLGAPRFEQWFLNDERRPHGHYDRLFLSNRYSPIETAIWKRMKGRYRRLCGFEDGFATYLNHWFRDASVRDWSWPIHRIYFREHLRAKLDRLIGARKARMDLVLQYVPGWRFKEIYSVLPNLPAYPFTVRKRPILHEFRTAFGATEGNADQSRQCVFLGQSLVKDGLIDDEAYRSIVANCLKASVDRYERVYFKRHPREDPSIGQMASSIGCQSLPERFDRVPVEFFLARNPGTDVIGFWTTTLLYASVLDVRAFTVGAAIAGANAPDSKIRESWDVHAPVMDRFGVERFALSDLPPPL